MAASPAYVSTRSRVWGPVPAVAAAGALPAPELSPEAVSVVSLLGSGESTEPAGGRLPRIPPGEEGEPAPAALAVWSFAPLSVVAPAAAACASVAASVGGSVCGWGWIGVR